MSGPKISYRNRQESLHVGKRFGKLIAIEMLPEAIHGSLIFKCLCDCGHYRNVSKSNLDSKKNPQTSCGCGRFADTNHGLIKTLYIKYKHEAKNRSLDFSLDEQTFERLIFSNCYYCTQEPSKIMKYRQTEVNLIYNGIDRVDNSMGYSTANSVSCCTDCNLMKRTLSKQAFLKKIKDIYEHFHLDNNWTGN